MKAIKRHKKLVIGLFVVIIAAAAGLTVFFRTRGTNTEAKEVKQNTISLSKQTLTESISATGTIESGASKTVSADVNGLTVKKVKVSVGDSVKKGQKLVTFDKSSLEEALEEAKENLANAKSEASQSIADAKEQLSEAQSAYTAAKKEAAQAKAQAKKAKAQAKKALQKAQKKVTSLQKKVNAAKDEQTKRELEEQLTKAQEELTQARTAYENASSGTTSTQTTTSVTSNTSNTTGNNGNGGNNTSTSTSAIKTAKSNLKNAQNSAKKSIKEAQKQVDEAKKNLEKCVVTAPISGIITAVGVEDGDTYSGGTLFQIEDTSSFQVTTTVDEYDISNVSVGQKAVILTEATDNEEINGEITFVAPSTSATASVTSSGSSGGGGDSGMSGSSSSSSDGYEVVINITDKNDKLKMGMTAKCSIILNQASDVFAVPYDAVHKDDNGNDVIYVAKSESDTSDYEEVQVTKGMESDYYVEISGDSLEEGMFVVIPTDETESSSDSDSNDNNMFPGGNMGGNMGGGPGGNRGNHSGNNGGGMGGPPSN